MAEDNKSQTQYKREPAVRLFAQELSQTTIAVSKEQGDKTFKTNVTKGSQYYNAPDLNENTFYNISTHTFDTSGNINLSWVNSTARTSDYIPGIITWTTASARIIQISRRQ